MNCLQDMVAGEYNFVSLGIVSKKNAVVSPPAKGGAKNKKFKHSVRELCFTDRPLVVCHTDQIRPKLINAMSYIHTCTERSSAELSDLVVPHSAIDIYIHYNTRSQLQPQQEPRLKVQPRLSHSHSCTLAFLLFLQNTPPHKAEIAVKNSFPNNKSPSTKG